MELEGNVRAGFRSDVKSYSVSNGRKCVNLHRLGYPGKDKDNLCTDLENDCNGELKTSLWNEFIVTPIKILDVTRQMKKRNDRVAKVLDRRSKLSIAGYSK